MFDVFIMDTTVFTKSADMDMDKLYMYVYLCTRVSVCVYTGVMGKCQDGVCVSLLSLSFYPPHHTRLDHRLKQASAMFTQLVLHVFICYLYYYSIRPHPSS